MLSTHWIAGGAVLLCGAAAWCDLQYRRIPNALTLPTVVIALCLHGVTHGLPGLLSSLAGMFVAALLVVPGYALGFTGAGDVKLLAAVGALLGLPMALFAALLSLVLGGVLSVLLSLWRRNLSSLFRNTWGMGRWLVVRSTGAPVAAPVASGKGVPLGVAIAVATLVVVFGPWFGAAR
ncbi:MAG TPA: A24 family peptidase [Candidatus Polarisedimenticolia bacterium]|nr:A24 family peptidase [Candidatus Polarisedimenticolia bacterium]